MNEMNEMSQGSLPGRSLTVRPALALALFSAFTATVAGCPGPTPHAGAGGSGGSTSTSDASSSSSTTSSSSSSSTGGVCQKSTDCGSSTTCKASVCVSGVCGAELTPAGKMCSDDGGKMCNGKGQCVACLVDVDCLDNTVPAPCVGGKYFAPPTCKEGTCEAGQTKDCASAGKICTPSGCAGCTSNTDCDTLTQDGCKTGTCVGDVCNLTPTPQGTPCLPASAGTCDGNGSCVQAKYVFVTSEAVPATLGSALLADANCQAVAASAGLGGTWMSWTSDITTSPAMRFTKSMLPYKLLDGTKIAHDWADLTNGNIEHGINMTETSEALSTQDNVWTGTKPDGKYSGVACDNWVALNPATVDAGVGIVGATGTDWTASAAPAKCSLNARLYCFQQ